MKNVLFATTALVAFAGAASAASHGSNVTLDWSGDFEAGYNDVIEGGVFGSASLGLDVTVDFGDSVTGAIGFDLATAGITWSYVEFNYDAGSSLTAMLRYGDLNDKGASERYYSDRSGMNVDVENHDGGNDVVAEVSFGSISVAAGCEVDTAAATAGQCLGMNVGVGATFGSIELGVGYDDGSNGQNTATAVSADATFGAFSLGVSYADGSTVVSVKDVADTNDADATVNPGATVYIVAQNSIGVEVGYDISDSLSVGAYYAMNSVDGDSYGVSADFSAGALSLSAYYDHSIVFGATLPVGTDVDGDGFYTGGQTAALVTTDSYGLDLGYDVSDMLTMNAGVFNDGAFVYYIGVDYAVNDNITATLSYATSDAISGPEYKDGITALITASF